MAGEDNQSERSAGSLRRDSLKRWGGLAISLLAAACAPTPNPNKAPTAAAPTNTAKPTQTVRPAAEATQTATAKPTSEKRFPTATTELPHPDENQLDGVYADEKGFFVGLMDPKRKLSPSDKLSYYATVARAAAGQVYVKKMGEGQEARDAAEVEATRLQQTMHSKAGLSIEPNHGLGLSFAHQFEDLQKTGDGYFDPDASTFLQMAAGLDEAAMGYEQLVEDFMPQDPTRRTAVPIYVTTGADMNIDILQAASLVAANGSIDQGAFNKVLKDQQTNQHSIKESVTLNEGNPDELGREFKPRGVYVQSGVQSSSRNGVINGDDLFLRLEISNLVSINATDDQSRTLAYLHLDSGRAILT